MIILLGPDGTGKTVLAKHMTINHGNTYYHFTQHSGYLDYIKPLVNLDMTNAVLDRHAICEYPYSTVMNRDFKFTIKEWHNIITMTLIQRPLILLCTHKPQKKDYPDDQYMPYEKWDECLALYKSFLNSNHIAYREFDYARDVDGKIFAELDRNNWILSQWWRDQWRAGYGCAGSSSPQFLIVAERIGPNNMNNIPFETGPTGWMMSRLLQATKTPLGSIAITNMIKGPRGDKRKVNEADILLLKEEITNLKPKKVIFMGSIAKQGIAAAKELGCEVESIVHLGYLNHRGIKDMTGYYNEWRKILGLVPTVSYK